MTTENSLTSFVAGLVGIIGGIGLIVGLGVLAQYLDMPKFDMGWFAAGAVMGAALSLIALVWFIGRLQ